jgi:ABC-type dipeptide/oligopeptide/nickel transport system ATPase subunit
LAGDQVSANEILSDANDKAADNCADRAGDAAKERAGESIEEHPTHHIGIEKQDRSHHYAGGRANGSGQAQANSEHTSDRNAARPCGIRILRRGPHRQPGCGETEECEEQNEHHQRDADYPSSAPQTESGREKQAGALSGGEQQMLAIARASIYRDP